MLRPLLALVAISVAAISFSAPLTTRVIFPETANLTYESSGFNALFQAQYFGKGQYDVDEAPDARNIMGVGDWWLFNATVGAKVNDQFGLKLIVDNVFDSAPPYPAPAGSGNAFKTYFSGILGRYFRVAANVKF